MNVITDTINEIRKMRVRKVSDFVIKFKVTLARVELRDDSLQCTNDMEDTYGCN